MASASDDGVSSVIARVRALIAAEESAKEELLRQVTVLEREIDQHDQRIAASRTFCDALAGESGHDVGDEVQHGDDEVQPRSAASASPLPAPATGSERAGSGGGSRRKLDAPRRIRELIAGEPEREWTTPLVHERLPDIDKSAIRTALNRLLDQGVLARPSHGVFVHASTTAATAPHTSTMSRRCPPAARAAGEVDAAMRRVGQLVLTAPTAAWRLADIAEATGLTQGVVHEAVQQLVRNKGLVTTINGAYVLPGHMAGEGRSRVS